MASASDISRADRTYTVAVTRAVQELIDEIREELSFQGHNLSGGLFRSIRQRVETTADRLVSEVEMLAYGAVLNDGVKPSRIPFGRPTSGMPGRRSAFIAGLQAWVKERGIETNDALALRIAFRIAKVMRREGSPTRGSRKFSRNGRRRGFFNVGLRRGQGRMERSVGEAAADYLHTLLSATVDDLAGEYENLLAL